MKTCHWSPEEISHGLRMQDEGASYEAIAEELDRAVNATRTRLQRARRELGEPRPLVEIKGPAWSDAYRRHVEFNQGWPRVRGDAAFVRALLTEMLGVVRGQSV